MTKKYLEEEKGLTPRLVMEEATRCLLCLDAPCSQSCPAGTDPAKFIRSFRFKNVEGAVTTIRENNILGGICARVCPVEKYCEKACSRSGIDKPIQISKIQRYLTDYEACTHMQVLQPKKLNGKNVAVVGSGPAGLTAAGNLAMQGYAVTVYEKYPKAGGYLRYGIPSYRLPNEVVDQEVKIIENLGVKFIFNTKVGIDVLLENLKKEYDAVVLAVGFAKGKMLEMFNETRHVELAVDFLARVKEKKGKIRLPKNAVVIGGGDVAMDCATTLKRLGVENVTDVAYEQFSEFRASKAELELTREEGVTILDGYVPVNASKSGTLTFKHRVINSQLKIKSGLTILAVGQLEDLEGLNITKDDLKSNYQVGKSNLFFAGDIAQGDKTVVYAVKTGKEVCKDVMNYLGGNK